MKKYNPTTPSRRSMTVVAYRGVVSNEEPKKSLVKGFRRGSGRNHHGRITSRHRGGGHKRLYREIDFRLNKKDVPFTVESIEYDPNRSAFIALVLFVDGARHYIVAGKEYKVGGKYIISDTAPLKPGNRTYLGRIPVGTSVHSIELKPNGGAKMVRSAGSYAEIVAVDGKYVNLKLPSSEIRKVPASASATIGEISNSDFRLQVLGKAGRSRWLGRRPTVRGSAMNPVDHPYGGGEGKQGRGTRRNKTKWGKIVGPGKKTRSPKKYSNRLIVSRRKVGKRK